MKMTTSAGMKRLNGKRMCLTCSLTSLDICLTQDDTSSSCPRLSLTALTAGAEFDDIAIAVCTEMAVVINGQPSAKPALVSKDVPNSVGRLPGADIL